MDNLENTIAIQQLTDLSLFETSINFLICVLLTTLVSWTYKKYSTSLGSKSHIGSILPLIGLTVFLVITVVKSSLALSLGLVGALSIVRFRTPIKEPEELGYLFLTIAVGLGLGAGYNIVTVVIVSLILFYLFLTRRKTKHGIKGEYTLIINSSNNLSDEIDQKLSSILISHKLIRYETDKSDSTYFFNIAFDDSISLGELRNQLTSIDSNLRINIVESGINW
mgnify:CR=1 FL=1